MRSKRFTIAVCIAAVVSAVLMATFYAPLRLERRDWAKASVQLESLDAALRRLQAVNGTDTLATFGADLQTLRQRITAMAGPETSGTRRAGALAALDTLARRIDTSTRRREVDTVAVSSALRGARGWTDSLRHTLQSPSARSLTFGLAEIAAGAVRLLFAWPVLLAAFVGIVVLSRRGRARFEEFLRPFESIKFFSAELQLNKQTKDDAEATVRRLRAQVVDRYSRVAAHHKIYESLEVVSRSVSALLRDPSVVNSQPKAGGAAPAIRLPDAPNIADARNGDHVDPQLFHPRESVDGHRCTVYVPDLLFAEHLYQLVDYSPRGDKDRSGRVYPFHQGIIGRAWRLGRSAIDGTVSGEEDELIRNWGMTREQARKRGSGLHSFAGVLLHNSDRERVGVLYIDAPWYHAFGTDEPEVVAKRIETYLTDECQKAGLISKLTAIRNEVHVQSLLIRIHGTEE